MLKLAQQSLGNVSGNVATAGSLADLGGEPPRDSGRQLLGTGRLAHASILPAVGSEPSSLDGRHLRQDQEAEKGRPSGVPKAGVVMAPTARGSDHACRTRLVTESRNSAARDRDLPSSGISAQPTA